MELVFHISDDGFEKEMLFVVLSNLFFSNKRLLFYLRHFNPVKFVSTTLHCTLFVAKFPLGIYWSNVVEYVAWL